MTVTILRADDIAVVTVDNPPVNALSRDVRQGLWNAAEKIDADPSLRAAVLICAGRTFIAGADVREFGKTPEPPHLPDLVARIESAATPWVAAIHGSALGGGLEVALGCRFRVAVEGASLGLPEVSLGIIPGAGGTVRTPRLVGVENAVELVTSGKPVKAKAAKEMGLIDDVVAGDLQSAAIDFARAALGGALPEPINSRGVKNPDADFWNAAEKRVAKIARGASANGRALASIRHAASHGFDEAMAFERETFLDLRGSDEAAALRRIFFAERAATRPAHLKDVAPREIKTVAVIGGGTMGAGILAALRDAGLSAVLVERDAEALERGESNLRRIFEGGVKRGKLTEAQAQERLAGVRGTTDYATLEDVDLVIEAVFEDLGVKRAVFAELNKACRADSILATNTSYLDPRAIAEGLSHPERFIGLHFFSPANVMKLLEIVPTPETAPETLATGFALAAKLRKMPVEAGICDGFIGNRILKRYRAAAEELVRAGVPIAEIDGAMKGYGMAMGPFAAQDLGGLDIAYLQRQGARERGEDVPQMLGDLLVEAGRKGQKTGGGWYDYQEGDRTPQPSAEVSKILVPHIAGEGGMGRAAIAARLIGEMAEEGAAIVDEEIARQPVDVDLVKIHGYGFLRWRGGPMFHAMRRGVAGMTDDLGRAPSAALKRVIEAG